MIDVALVLLIFFMLTTTYEQMRKEFSPPPGEREGVQGKTITANELKTFTIRASARLENDQLVYRIENEVVAEDDLEKKLKEWLEKTGHSKLAMDVEAKAPWRAVVRIQDAAAGAKISEIIRVSRPVRE